MDTLLFTWYQALQLAALGPCLFIIFFLCVTAHNFSKVIVPLFYFVALSCNFLLPLSDAMNFGIAMHGALITGKSITAAMSFLLIIEFITGTIPPPVYWAVLAIPLLGGSSINYVMLIAKGDVCIREDLCAAPLVFKQFYEIFSALLIFLLTIILYHRLGRTTERNSAYDTNKRAIIYSLIALNLLIIAIGLLYISGHVEKEQAGIAITIVRMGFIYLVLTFVFRVFDRSFEIDYARVPNMQPKENVERDMALADDVRKLLVQEKMYRTMELSREMLARKLAVTENRLSRVINKYFSQNFNMLINQYRIEEAKERLLHEDTAVTTIAFEVGFNSIPSFNRVFKQSTGLSPSEFRNKKSEVAA